MVYVYVYCGIEYLVYSICGIWYILLMSRVVITRP